MKPSSKRCNTRWREKQLISKDGKETLVLLEIDPQWTSTRQLRPLLDTVKQLLASTTKGTRVKASVTGVPAIKVELRDATVRDELTFNIVGPLVAIAIAFVVFRRAASVSIVLAGAALGVLWTVGLLGLLGEAINPVNAVIAPLTLTIGLTDSVHMLMHIRSDRAKGAAPLQAAVSTIRAAGFPSALASLTSAVGFASLGIAELDVLAKFGLGSALGVVLAFISVMTVVPLLGSSFLGDHIQVRGKLGSGHQESRTKWHTHLAIFVVDHRVTMLLVSLLVTSFALYMGVQIKADPRIANGLPTAGETFREFQSIEQDFGGSLPLVVTVRWNEDARPTAAQVYAAIADAHHALEGKSITGPPMSLVNVYQSMPERDRNPQSLFQQLSQVPKGQLKNVFDRDSRRATIIARCQDAGGHPVDDLLSEIESEFAELTSKHPGFDFRVTRTILEGIRASNKIVADLVVSMFMAVPLTLGVLMLALKSFKAGVIALLPNVFPMAMLAATMVAFGQSITLTGAAVFVMCFGIAVDDTIHAITAFNRNFEAGQSVRDAIINAYRELGDAIISTTAILIGGLGVVMLGQSYFTRMFGLMFCIGLFWAVVGDLIILPAVLACWPHKRKGTIEEAPHPIDDLNASESDRSMVKA